MPNPSATLARIQAVAEAKYNALFHAKMDMLLQMGQDAAMISAHESLGMGPGRAEAFCAAYTEAFNEMASMMCEDQKDDAEYAYTREKVDRQIRAIVGEDKFQPWEVRYGH